MANILVTGGCAVVAALTARSAAELTADLPRHTERIKEIISHLRESAARWPWLDELTNDSSSVADLGGTQLLNVVTGIASATAALFSQGMVACVYLFFLML